MAMRKLYMVYADPPLDSAEVQMNALGIREWMAPQIIDRPAGTGDYLFMHFHTPVVIGMPGGPQACPAHTLMIWSPHDGHYYGQTARRWCHSWMRVDGQAITRSLAAAGVPLVTPILGVAPGILEGTVELLYREIHDNACADEAIVADHLDILARAIGRAVRARGDPAESPRWLDLRRHLEECATEPMRLSALARRAGCSVPHLCAEFKRRFGCPVIEFVIRQRMHRACMLLRNRNATVTEVAAEVGYDDVHHFSKLFHKRHGVPPSTLRDLAHIQPADV